METKPVQLTATAKIDGAALEVRYTVKNNTADTLLLVNRIHQWTDKGHVVSDDRFYTVVVGDELRLTAAWLPVPDHVDVESPDVPLVTRVAPNASLDGVLRASLPLEPFHPYPGVVGWAEVPRTYPSVAVVIGWLPERPGLVSEQTDDKGAKLLYIDHRTAATAQQLAATKIDASFATHIKPAR